MVSESPNAKARTRTRKQPESLKARVEPSHLSREKDIYQWLATRDTQFGEEVALVMQTTHDSADSIPIVSTSVCFLPLKMYTGITQILEFEYKTGMF